MAAVEFCPDFVFKVLYNLRSNATLQRDDDHRYRLRTDDGDWYLPTAKDAIRITHVSLNWKFAGYKRLLDKYQFEGFVEIEDGDVVLDISSYIGEFSRAVLDEFDVEVVAVEPDPQNARYTQANTKVRVIETAVWDECGRFEFNSGEHGSESSFLKVDTGESELTTVHTVTIDEIIEQIGAVDFLKLEVEGTEPEAFRGMVESRPQKIAADCGYERHGESTVEECVEILREYGYDTRSKGTQVFGYCNP